MKATVPRIKRQRIYFQKIVDTVCGIIYNIISKDVIIKCLNLIN